MEDFPGNQGNRPYPILFCFIVCSRGPINPKWKPRGGEGVLGRLHDCTSGSPGVRILRAQAEARPSAKQAMCDAWLLDLCAEEDLCAAVVRPVSGFERVASASVSVFVEILPRDVGAEHLFDPTNGVSVSNHYKLKAFSWGAESNRVSVGLLSCLFWVGREFGSSGVWVLLGPRESGSCVAGS